MICKNLFSGAAMLLLPIVWWPRFYSKCDAKTNVAGLQTMVPRTHKGLPQKTHAGSKRHAVQQQLVELKSAFVGTAGAVASNPRGVSLGNLHWQHRQSGGALNRRKDRRGS